MNIGSKPAKKLIRSKSGLKIVAANDEDRSPFEQQEPEWIPDNEVLFCTKCHQKFGFTRRRHHCRRCGLIFCSSCCNSKLLLPRMCFFDPVRVCDLCAPVTFEENDFFQHQLRNLLIGSSFEYCVIDSCDVSKYSCTCICRLSPDHRHLIFNNSDILPVCLNSILSLKILKGSDGGICGVNVEYQTDDLEAFELKSVDHPSELISGSEWITSLFAAFALFMKRKNKADALSIE